MARLPLMPPFEVGPDDEPQPASFGAGGSLGSGALGASPLGGADLVVDDADQPSSRKLTPSSTGAAAHGVAGDLQAAVIAAETSDTASMLGDVRSPTTAIDKDLSVAFERVLSAVSVVDAILKARPSSRHNQGPPLGDDLSIDEAEINRLIAQLRELGPRERISTETLTLLKSVADPVENKWRERREKFILGAIGAAGAWLAKSSLDAVSKSDWFANVYSALESVFSAVTAWMNLIT